TRPWPLASREQPRYGIYTTTWDSNERGETGLPYYQGCPIASKLRESHFSSGDDTIPPLMPDIEVDWSGWSEETVTATVSRTIYHREGRTPLLFCCLFLNRCCSRRNAGRGGHPLS